MRFGDLDPAYLLHAEAREMVGFAERLYRSTNLTIPSLSDTAGRQGGPIGPQPTTLLPGLLFERGKPPKGPV